MKIFLSQLHDILSMGFKNKFYSITKKQQEFKPDVQEYWIKVSSDTPHWYITDYLTRASSHYDIHAVEVNGKILFVIYNNIVYVDLLFLVFCHIHTVMDADTKHSQSFR